MTSRPTGRLAGLLAALLLTASAADAARPAYVTVVGDVAEPGVYEIAAGTTVADVLEASKSRSRRPRLVRGNVTEFVGDAVTPVQDRDVLLVDPVQSAAGMPVVVMPQNGRPYRLLIDARYATFETLTAMLGLTEANAAFVATGPPLDATAGPIRPGDVLLTRAIPADVLSRLDRRYSVAGTITPRREEAPAPAAAAVSADPPPLAAPTAARVAAAPISATAGVPSQTASLGRDFGDLPPALAAPALVTPAGPADAFVGSVELPSADVLPAPPWEIDAAATEPANSGVVANGALSLNVAEPTPPPAVKPPAAAEPPADAGVLTLPPMTPPAAANSPPAATWTPTAAPSAAPETSFDQFAMIAADALSEETGAESGMSLAQWLGLGFAAVLLVGGCVVLAGSWLSSAKQAAAAPQAIPVAAAEPPVAEPIAPEPVLAAPEPQPLPKEPQPIPDEPQPASIPFERPAARVAEPARPPRKARPAYTSQDILRMPTVDESTPVTPPPQILGDPIGGRRLRVDAAHDGPSGPHFGRRKQQAEPSDDVLARALQIMKQENHRRRAA